MNAREQARFDMIKRVGTFGTNNAADLNSPVPPAAAVTAGQTQAKQLFESRNAANSGLIARIAKNAETQQSGAGSARGGTTAKTVLRDALFLELKGINRTAAAVAESRNKPEIMEKFRMRYGVGDAVLVARANAIVDAAEVLSTDFVAHGHATTFAADLRGHIAAFESAQTTQESGSQEKVGATAQFAPLLEEAMTAVKQLDAFMHNFYRSNAATMGEWHSASQTRPAKAVKQKRRTICLTTHQNVDHRTRVELTFTKTTKLNTGARNSGVPDPSWSKQ